MRFYPEDDFSDNGEYNSEVAAYDDDFDKYAEYESAEPRQTPMRHRKRYREQ
jgi:hypothetical protein